MNLARRPLMKDHNSSLTKYTADKIFRRQLNFCTHFNHPNTDRCFAELNLLNVVITLR